MESVQNISRFAYRDELMELMAHTLGAEKIELPQSDNYYRDAYSYVVGPVRVTLNFFEEYPGQAYWAVEAKGRPYQYVKVRVDRSRVEESAKIVRMLVKTLICD